MVCRTWIRLRTTAHCASSASFRLLCSLVPSAFAARMHHGPIRCNTTRLRDTEAAQHTQTIIQHQRAVIAVLLRATDGDYCLVDGGCVDRRAKKSKTGRT